MRRGLADARVIRIEISRVELRTFDGVSFGETGPYEKLVGRVFGEIDPVDPSSAVITDIDLVPRNAVPPTIKRSPYPAFASKTNADGNDVAGIRLPQIAVSLATYTGWGVRAAAFAGDDLCDAAGQQIDFARTEAERLRLGDPQLSVEERYESNESYVRAITDAARDLQVQRLLLPEDVERIIEEAEARRVDR